MLSSIPRELCIKKTIIDYPLLQFFIYPKINFGNSCKERFNNKIKKKIILEILKISWWDMKFSLRKIDTIVIVALVIIAGMVFLKVGYIPSPVEKKPPKVEFIQDDVNNKLIVSFVSTDILWSDIEIKGDCDTSLLGEYVLEGDEIINCRGTITITHIPTGTCFGTWGFKEIEKLPASLTPGLRDISPNDEGPHYHNLMVSREWWYYTALLNSGCDLPGWTVSISFNHMARNDLYFDKPDMLVAILQDPDGNTYGGIIDKERPLGILREPSLNAEGSSKGFKVSFERSFIQGKAPNWRIYIDGRDIDPKNDITIDLQYFAPSPGIWLFNSKILDKSDANTGSYVFLGCEVKGSIKINGIVYRVEGIGHHEHTWTSSLIVKSFIDGWDICHVKLDNGWIVYYYNYYITSQLKSTLTSKINPFSEIIITTDHGETVTLLENIDVEIVESDKVFLFLNIPSKISVTAKAGLAQVILSPYNIKLNIDINADKTYAHEWKRLAHVGMKLGRVDVSCKLSWNDNGEHNIETTGIGAIWLMRH